MPANSLPTPCENPSCCALGGHSLMARKSWAVTSQVYAISTLMQGWWGMKWA